MNERDVFNIKQVIDMLDSQMKNNTYSSEYAFYVLWKIRLERQLREYYERI